MFALKNHGRGLGRIDGWWNDLPPWVIQPEIFRVLILNLSGKPGGADAPPRTTMPLTVPSLLSRATRPPVGFLAPSNPLFLADSMVASRILFFVYCTTSVTLLVWLTLPEVPVTVIV